MSLVRWKDRGELSPWAPLRDIEGQFNRLFGELARDYDLYDRGWAPAVDLKEDEQEYTLEADLPGMKKEEIDITVVDNVVMLKGERKHETETKEKGYHRVERRYGSFERSFELPGGFDANKINAHFDNGVLKVTLPKREEAKPKQIEVKVN
ncbi:MAG: Hsp20/alpha crystallin family protein [Candidatus Hydrogenedentes bacterium]|nr:Hsp20/alpha crystallin family protein [Candidatus Hydrogenedentota bacterium]